jgi:SSS family solute:Na+ symporter
VALAGLLASFMAGMAANISAFNTVFSYDIWQQYVKKDRPDSYYLNVGRWATVGATVIAIFTALLASGYNNLMDYLQTLFGFFNAPLFATFILGMFWKRMTSTAGWAGLVAGTLGAIVVAVLSKGSLGSLSTGAINLSGQGASFVAAGAAFVVDIIVSVIVSQVTRPKPVELLAGLVYSETPKADLRDPRAHELHWYQSPTKLAGISLVLVIVLNILFR